jgi:hypothetical protein
MALYSFDDRNIKWNTLTLPPVGELSGENQFPDLGSKTRPG